MSLLPFPERKTHVGARIFRIVCVCARITPRVFTHAPHTHTSETDYSISGVKTTLRRALIRACVPTNAVARPRIPGDAPIHACRDVSPVHALLPSDPCYCCDLMKCYARSPAITFPLRRLTPHSVGLVSRGGTLGHLSSLTIPGTAASTGDFCTLLKDTPISYDIYRENLIDFQRA